jgi:hypothetical protein
MQCADGGDCDGGEKAIVKGHVKFPLAILLDGFFFHFCSRTSNGPVYFKDILSE